MVDRLAALLTAIVLSGCSLFLVPKPRPVPPRECKETSVVPAIDGVIAAAGIVAPFVLINGAEPELRGAIAIPTLLLAAVVTTPFIASGIAGSRRLQRCSDLTAHDEDDERQKSIKRGVRASR